MYDKYLSRADEIANANNERLVGKIDRVTRNGRIRIKWNHRVKVPAFIQMDNQKKGVRALQDDGPPQVMLSEIDVTRDVVDFKFVA